MYVTGLTLELEGSINPQAWMSLTPAVWEFRVACMSPAMGRRGSGMLQDPGKAHKRPWKIESSTLQQFRFYETGVSPHSGLRCFKYGLEAWKNSAGYFEIFLILWR